MKKMVMTATVLQLGSLLAMGGTAQAAAGAAGIRVGGLQITPGISLSSKYDDNIFKQEVAPKRSLTTVISPGVSISAERGNASYRLDYLLTDTIYHSSHADDAVDHTIKGAADFDLTSRLIAGLTAGYKIGTDARGSTFTGTAVGFTSPDRYHESSVGGTMSYGVNARLDLNADYSNKRYDNHQFQGVTPYTITRDIDTSGVGIAFAYPVGPKTEAVLEARYKRFDYKYLSATSNLDSNEQSYYAGIDWQATAKTSGSLRVGYLKKSFSQATLGNGSQFSWELGTTWEPRTYSSFTLSTTSKPVETDGTGSYTKSIDTTLSWNHQWNSLLGHTVDVGYLDSSYQGTATSRHDKTTSAGFAVNYQWMRWLGASVAYDFSKRSSNAALAGYRDNVWSFTLTGSL